MKKAFGLRRYLYEYVYHQAVERAREQTSEIVPISQAKLIRERVDEILGEQGSSLDDPRLGISACVGAIDQALGENVEDYEAQFGDPHQRSPRFLALQDEFMHMVGVGGTTNPSSVRLPISPYDPRWSERSSVKQAGTSLLYISDEEIMRSADGEVSRLSEPRHGGVQLWALDEDGHPVEAGRAMTWDDASGLTALMPMMSQKEYEDVREWVIDGGRDPATGRLDRNAFMPERAVARSAAVLTELKRQGVSYEVMRDRHRGQIKAKLAGTGMEIRLIDAEHEAYAGARIYDNGTEIRYSTNHRVAGGMAVHSPTPDEAVRLLHFAQGLPIERQDRPGVLVGSGDLTHTERGRGGAPVEVSDSYVGEREAMFVVDDYRLPGQDEPSGSQLMLRRDAKNRTLPARFAEVEMAEEYLSQAVASARESMHSSLGVDELIAYAAGEHERTGGSVEDMEAPAYSADPEIAAIQRSYWDVLTGARSDLLRPGATEEMYREKLEKIGELQADEAPDMGNLVYGGTAAEKVRAHSEDVPFELIGTWEVQEHEIDGEWVERRFDPARVAKYMESPTGQWSNLDNIASALRRCEVPPEHMLGTGFQATRFKDRLVRFDEASAVRIEDHPSEFVTRMGEVVSSSIERNGGRSPEILIDDQGVVRWTAQKVRRNGSTTPITGEIGQIFDVGEHGEIVTRFASGENALIVPGYEARIAAPEPGQRPTSVEERTILRGYEQLMTERIQHQIAGDMVAGRTEVGEPGSVNGVYSQLYGTKHPVDFIERATTMTVDRATGEIITELDPWTASILETEAKRVRYSNEIKQGSTVYAEYQAQRDRSDPADDNTFDAWKLTGGRNMAVLTGRDASGRRGPEGYFDPVMTGGAINQGIVRYLTTDAEVAPDGRIIPGDPSTLTGSRAPLMTRPELETMRYDPFDRQQMTTSTIMQSSEVTEPTGTALMTFGGWTADDPIVVSQEFAEKHRIRGAGGQERSLVVGDKLSDLHGNKGVVSLIVDRDMDLDTAREQGIENEVAWFKRNSRVDVVMSPFSLISRRNAGSARELMSGDRTWLQHPFLDEDGTEREAIDGGVGEMRFVVTHMAVDEKTKIYDDEQVLQGKGRKASSQLAWALQSQDCPAIMREFYGHNSGAEANLREYLLVTGMDMEADGTLRVIGEGQSVDERPERRLIPMPELERTKTGSLNTTKMRRSFGELIGDRGGDMEIPFPLVYPTGEQTEAASGTSWKLPVLSSHLRSGQEFDDGSSIKHDYTRSYQDVFVEACRYRYLADQLEDPGISTERREAARAGMGEAVGRAQRSFESITTDVKNRVLTGKNNIFKTGLMSSRLSDSATMVWTADPRLDIDQVALSSVKAEQLGLDDGDHALVWRDPVLRDAGVRYMRVAIDDRLTGAAINPVMDQCFDGDFDGDAVAVVKLHSEAAKREALEKLSVPANLLDRGQVRADGSYPLAMQRSLDTQVALSKNPALAEELDSLVVEANAIDRELRADGADIQELRERQIDVTGQLSDVYREAQSSEFGSALTFSDREAHLRSVREVCVDTGAKGSEKKLEDYARYLGDQDGTPGIGQVDQEASMFATAIKAHGTGLGGSFSQRAVRALRGEDLKAVLEVTYPVTQSILQAKHDAAEARHKYEMLQGPGRDLWRGRLLEHEGIGQWRSVVEDREPVQATREEWEEQFIRFYESPDGFNVKINPEHVSRVADALEDPTTGRMRNLEDDPTLQGTLMDRMAYGGDFEVLTEAAKAHESIFDGEKNAQFASAGTRHVLRDVERQLEHMDAGLSVEDAELSVASSVLKSDVLAEHEERSRARGAMRRSAHAVSVGQPVAATTGVPKATAVLASEEPEEPTVDDDYEMEL